MNNLALKQRVSIIIPVYNVEKYIKRCINSVLCQTYENLEIILVDDGSTDNSSVICDEYAGLDGRVVVVHKQNQGLGMARNSGIEIAGGDWYCFVDSDDFITPHYAEYLLDACVKNGCLTAQCKYKTGSAGEFEEQRGVPNVTVLNWSDYFILCATSAGSTVWGCCYNIYHKSLFKNVRFSGLKHSEDVPTVSKLIWEARRKPFALVDKYMYYYFQRGDSIMHKKAGLSNLGQIDAYEAVLDFWKNKNEQVISDFFTGEYFVSLVDTFTLLCRDNVTGWDRESISNKISGLFNYAKGVAHPILHFSVGADEAWNGINTGKNCVMYGFGFEGAKMLPWLLHFDFKVVEVWDMAAADAYYIDGVRVCRAHGEIDKSTTVLISINDRRIEFSVTRYLLGLGFKNIVCRQALENALRWARLNKFLPFLIRG